MSAALKQKKLFLHKDIIRSQAIAYLEEMEDEDVAQLSISLDLAMEAMVHQLEPGSNILHFQDHFMRLKRFLAALQ